MLIALVMLLEPEVTLRDDSIEIPTELARLAAHCSGVRCNLDRAWAEADRADFPSSGPLFLMAKQKRRYVPMPHLNMN